MLIAQWYITMRQGTAGVGHCRSPVLSVGLASVVGALSLPFLLGCNELTGGSQSLPAGTLNPAFYNTPAGALGMRNAAILALENVLPTYLIDTGLLTDELDMVVPSTGLIDMRTLPEASLQTITIGGYPSDIDYSGLQGVRGEVSQAVGALATYDTTAPPALRGELYALDGYAEILLADFFCSGVPLSTLNYQKDYTYAASSTTEQVYLDALAQENTALAMTSDSARLQNLARVLKGRALLALGGTVNVAAAAQAVAAVPDGFQYQLAVQFTISNGSVVDLFDQNQVTESDREGLNGLPYLSSGDPRSAATQPFTGWTPVKYALAGFTPLTVADWIEARLIQAEAALQAHDYPTYLTLLNHLRQTATVPGQTTPLDTLTDPGDSPGDSARVSLLFSERAYWLFLTGHRQGDLRRLIRQYGRQEFQVYPTGQYPAGGSYGTDVTAPIPAAEYYNPHFHGCLDRDA
jgi:hypothetical protein